LNQTASAASAAAANHAGGRLDARAYELITQVCDEILFAKHHDMFPVHVWMTGSGTQQFDEIVDPRKMVGRPVAAN
jgi:fumarate hydratase class II